MGGMIMYLEKVLPRLIYPASKALNRYLESLDPKWQGFVHVFSSGLFLLFLVVVLTRLIKSLLDKKNSKATDIQSTAEKSTRESDPKQLPENDYIAEDDPCINEARRIKRYVKRFVLGVVLFIVIIVAVSAVHETNVADSGTPKCCNAKLLCNYGALALFVGETTEDSDFNKKAMEEDEESTLRRNSLFIHLHPKNGHASSCNECQLLLTTGSDWRLADGMDEWCASRAQELKQCFLVEKARFASDGRHIWLVCDTQSQTYFTICSYDLKTHEFRVIGDGDTIDEQPDGTILVKNRKTYQTDEGGSPLGAMWHDEWITPDGKMIRKSGPRDDLSGE